jgi:hypothetical protein
MNALKGALFSKTIWAAIATALLAHSDSVTNFVTAHISGPWAITILAALFAYLRTLTTSSLAAKGAPTP